MCACVVVTGSSSASVCPTLTLSPTRTFTFDSFPVAGIFTSVSLTLIKLPGAVTVSFTSQVVTEVVCGVAVGSGSWVVE